MKNIKELKSGNKFIFNNTMGKIKDLEKANVVVTLVKKIDDTKVVVKTNSIILGKELEFEIDYFLLK